MPSEIARHDLVAADPDAWESLLAGRRDLDGVPHLRDWARLGRPLIIRRFVPGEPGDGVPLGLPLPPADGKRRIGLALSAEAVRAVDPPSLADVASLAPAAWQASIVALLVLARDHGLTPRPFGALLWQAVTGLTYLSATSDLDLLWTGPTPRSLLDGLARIEATAPMRLDGEILLPDGGGVQWRELCDAPPGGTVLVKDLNRVAMRPAADLLR